jgi:hypothetical protein
LSGRNDATAVFSTIRCAFCDASIDFALWEVNFLKLSIVKPSSGAKTTAVFQN